MKKFIVILFAASIFFACIVYLLPRHDCDMDGDPEVERLTDMASRGNIDSIRSLYYYYKSTNAKAMQAYWALSGAKKHDLEMYRSYISIFSSYEKSEKEAVIFSLQNESNPDRCLIKSLQELDSNFQCQ